jgi:hypothetical protein
MRDGLANKRMGLWHLARMLGCTARLVNESSRRNDVSLRGLSLDVPPSPFRPDLP